MTYRCKLCGQGFMWQYDLLKHLRNHLEDLLVEVDQVVEDMGLYPHYRE